MRTGFGRRWADEWAGAALAVAVVCAVLLVPAIVAPREVARTTWVEARADGSGTSVNDSPAGYVGLVSLCGLAALAALGVGAVWERPRVAAALAAAAAFAYGAFVGVAYWQNLARGVVGLEGTLDSSMRPPEYTVDMPELLPVFVLVAVVGALAALALAVAWWPGPDGGQIEAAPPWLSGHTSDAARPDRPTE